MPTKVSFCLLERYQIFVHHFFQMSETDSDSEEEGSAKITKADLNDSGEEKKNL